MSRVFRIWQGMKVRCGNPNFSDYASYGGRGIKVCDRWRGSFENFLADMGEPPIGTSIDRINNDGHYEPGNCRWAKNETQQRNKRANRFLTYDGKTLCQKDWSDLTGIPESTIAYRVKVGWPLDRALRP